MVCSDMPIHPLAPMPPSGTNRRGAATRTNSDVLASKWPLVASAAYTKLAQAGVQAKDLTGLNPKLVKLATARSRLWAAIQAVQSASNEVNPQSVGKTPDAPVYNALRSLHGRLEKELLAFPLEVR